ncbi:MAG TPA: redox-regulated ATPase YchF [Bacteroidota bacterium]|nr:redox-regulated ATPase YchF [Candidatus Kapabacteria bacterium]HRS00942.1 redox-regulated ATPase YchF [Bacteroidota bacterium]HRT67800.1 redox-regulated ATPase YchF [Bacteroidota bacterium]
MQIGIIGYPYSGKTTLFETISAIHEDSQYQKKDENRAVIKVPDERLDILTKLFQPKRQVNATIEIVDFAGLQYSEKKGEIFTPQFIAKIKTVDALLHVVRGFDDPNVPFYTDEINMERDIRNIEDELIFADLIFVENRINKLQNELKKQRNHEEMEKELHIMQMWKENLENNMPLRELDFDENTMKYITNYQPLSAKPLLIALNLGENMVEEQDKIVNGIASKFPSQKIAILPFFAKIEMELSQLDEEEKQMFMREYGLSVSPLNRLIQSAYNLLGLQSFFTVGEDETRSWTIKKGMNAQQAAGVIHTDFYNKFIRAEVVHCDHLIQEGTIAKCREKGFLRLEGKDYIVKDGDILNIRHS